MVEPMLVAYTAVREIWLTHEAEFLAQLNDPKKAKEVQFMMQKLEQLYLERSKKSDPNAPNKAFEKLYQNFKKELYPRFQNAIKSKTKLELSEAEQTLLEELHRAALGFGKNPAEKYASVVAQILTEFPKWVAQIAGIPDSNNPAMTLKAVNFFKQKKLGMACIGPQIVNLSSRPCFYKPESGTDAIEIASGDLAAFTLVDGLATMLHNDMVYKVVGKSWLPLHLCGIYVDPTGDIWFANPTEAFVQWSSGAGWTSFDSFAGDNGWIALINAASAQ